MLFGAGSTCCPIDWDQSAWLVPRRPPESNVSVPRAGANTGPLNLLRLGAADAHIGVDWSTLSVKATFAVNGRAAGVELADLASNTGDGIRAITLNPAIPTLADGTLRVQVADIQGNISRVARHFSVQGSATTPTATFTATLAPPTATVTATRTIRPPRQSVDRDQTPTPAPTVAVGGECGTTATIARSARSSSPGPAPRATVRTPSPRRSARRSPCRRAAAAD
jgi:hypothetical protein